MAWTEDRWGNPWSPCPLCTAGAPGSCFSRGHPELCRHVQQDPERWGPVVATLPADDTPPDHPAPPATVAADLVVRAHLNGFTGYGQMVASLAREVYRSGASVAFESLGTDERFTGLPGWVKGRIAARTVGPVLQAAGPDAEPPPGRIAAALTMWESTRPRVAALAGFELVLVPSQWCAQAFQAAGLARPVQVIPLGVDTAAFRPQERPRGGHPITFGCAGRLSHGGVRKGLQDVIDGFVRAFPAGTPARLEVKVWPDDPPVSPPRGDERIRVRRDPFTAEGLAGWYRGLDVFVSASRGEGFGLQPLEAMACGVPIVAGFHSGHREYLDAACAWPLPYRTAPATGLYAGLGDWYEPDADALVELLRWLAANRDAIPAKGSAAARIAAAWTWGRSGQALVAALRAAGILAPAAAPPPPPVDPPPVDPPPRPAAPHALFRPAAGGDAGGFERPAATQPPSLLDAETAAEVDRFRRSCGSWRPLSDCGCGLARCARGKGSGGLVQLADCHPCAEAAGLA